MIVVIFYIDDIIIIGDDEGRAAFDSIPTVPLNPGPVSSFAVISVVPILQNTVLYYTKI